MTISKTLTSSAIAAALVAGIGFAYAQNTSNEVPNTSPAADQSPVVQPGVTSPSPDSSSTSTAPADNSQSSAPSSDSSSTMSSERQAQADRN